CRVGQQQIVIEKVLVLERASKRTPWVRMPWNGGRWRNPLAGNRLNRTPTRIAIVGAGGNAREIAAIIRDITDASQGNFEFVGYVISDMEHIGPHDSIERLLGNFDCLQSNGIEALAMGCGDPAKRLSLAAELSSRFPHLQWPTLVPPSALVDRSTLRL